MRDGDLTYDDFLQRLNIQDVLIDAGYHLNRRDGLRYPSYVRLDSDGRRPVPDKHPYDENFPFLYFTNQFNLSNGDSMLSVRHCTTKVINLLKITIVSYNNKNILYTHKSIRLIRIICMFATSFPIHM